MIKRFVTYSFLATMIVACSGQGGESASSAEGEAESAEAAQENNMSATPGELVTLPSGLQYEIIQEGNGQKPEVGDKVTVHYTGTLKATGDKFDSSLDRGQPFSFPVGQGRVIPGWDEGILLFNVGTKARLIIPSNLAYGPQDRPGIPANSDLIFEVEILDIDHIEPHKVYDVSGMEPQTTNSGLQYYIIEEGTGPQAKAGDMVSVHYYGYLKEGETRFDDSFSRGEPIQFPLGSGQVIPGWEEGIALLKEGSKAKLVIPYALAYGEQGRGPIPPAADLVFDVELVKIN